jgi:RNA methyltransferase, TrmH family
MLIQSKDNQKLKLAKLLFSSKKNIKKTNFFIIDNIKLIKEIYLKSPEQLAYILVCEKTNLDSLVFNNSTKIHFIEKNIFKNSFVDKTKKSVLAVCKVKKPDYLTILPKLKNILILDQISIPQNFGAIIRTAAAFNIDAIFYTKGTTFYYNPQTIRAAAGYIFEIPILELNKDTLIFLQEKSFVFYVLDIAAQKYLQDVNFSKKNAFVLGSEGNGIISNDLKNDLKIKKIKIPMKNNVESLNVAVTAGILLYHLFLKKII